MKVAVACSGLGHVARGIETWARDSAFALHERGVDVTLFAGAPLAIPCRVLPCLRRGGLAARWLARFSPPAAWRWGLKSAYGWEQLSFWRKLAPILRKDRYDILHVQDPLLADCCRKARKAGRLRTREILAHGTEEPPEFLAKFDYLQHLAPWHLDDALKRLGCDKAHYPYWTAIPNFVDTDVFRPASGPDEAARCRATLGVPADARVFGCVAAVQKNHKRIDYLVREFARAVDSGSGVGGETPYLLVAGARTDEAAGLVAEAERVAPGRTRFMLNLPRENMPDFYRALDVFVLPSLFEMMPIALLEAISSGIPVLVNEHPVLAWMAGAQGRDVSSDPGPCLDMSRDGELSRALSGADDAWRHRHSQAARAHAERLFSKPAVAARMIDYYRRVMTGE